MILWHITYRIFMHLQCTIIHIHSGNLWRKTSLELSATQHWANGHHFQALLYEQGAVAGKGHRPQKFPRWGMDLPKIFLTSRSYCVQQLRDTFSGSCNILIFGRFLSSLVLAMNPSTDFLAGSNVRSID